MSTYYATYFGLLFAVMLGTQGPRLQTGLYWGLLVGLFVFSGYRYEVGCDWTGYLYNWTIWDPRYTNPIIQGDPAHWAVINFLKSNGFSYPSLNVVTSAIFFLGLHVLARKQPNPLAFLVLAFPILIINMPMSGIRQGAAIGFVSMAFVAFSTGRPLVFAALVGMGSLFHSSAMIFFLLVPFVLGRYTRKNLLLAGMLALPGVYFLLQSDQVELATQRYLDLNVDAAGAPFRLALISLTGLGYFIFLKKRWEQRFPEDFKLASLGALMMICFFGLFFVSTVIGDRFGYYLIPIQLMIFARIPYLFRGHVGTLFSITPYAVLTAVFIIWTQVSWLFQQCYLPYDSVLF